MKRRYKIIISILMTLLTLIVIFAFSAGPLAKYIVLKYGPEYTGRKIELKNAKVNIFNGKIGLYNFKIYEKNGVETFFSIDKFELDLNLLKLIQKRVKIEGLGLENPKITINKNGDKYNFVDIIETVQKKTKSKNSETKKSNDSEVIIEEFEINNLNFEYKDGNMNEKFKMKIDDFKMPEMKISKNIDFSFYLLSKGNVELKTKIRINEKQVEINTEKLFLHFKFLKPFITTKLDVTKFDGTIYADTKINLDLVKKGVILSGMYIINGVEINDKNGEKLISLNNFMVDIKKISTLENIFNIRTIKIEKPYLNFKLYKSGNNLLSIIKKEKKKKSLKSEENKIEIKDYSLDEFLLTDAVFDFTDLSKQEHFKYRLYNFGISTSKIAKNSNGEKIELSLNLNDAASFIKSTVDIKNNDFTDIAVDLSVTNFKIDDFTHYIKNYMNISAIRGQYSGNIHLDYSLKNKKPIIKMNGISKLENVSIIDKKKSAEIFNIKSLNLDVEEANIFENKFIINSIKVDKMKIYGYIAKEGNTIQLLMQKQNKKAETNKKSFEKQMTLLIKKIDFTKGSIRVSDDTFEKQFNYLIDVPIITANNISTKKDKKSMYKIEMIMNKTGKFSASGNIRVGENFETVSKFKLVDFHFGDFKQLTEKYSNFITKDGVLNYDGSLVINNKEIKSENSAKILNVNIGEKKKILPLGISLNFVLSIIENDDGEVTLIVPVKGNMSDPKFSYRETVYIAIVNILSNIAKSPFSFINTGEDNKGLESMEVNLLDKEIPIESIKKLEKIANIIKRKKMINFEFIQVIDKENEYQQYLLQIIKEKYYREKLSSLANTTSASLYVLTNDDLEKISQITNLNPDFVSYVNNKAIDIKGSDKLDIYGKSEIILGKNIMEQRYNEVVNARNEFIKNKLKEFGVTLDRIEVRNATLEESGEILRAHYIVKIKQSESIEK